MANKIYKHNSSSVILVCVIRKKQLDLFQNLIALQEGGVKVCGDAVLHYFWRGFAEIFVLTCLISVLLDYAVFGVKKVWVTVIGDHEVSVVFWDPFICFFSLTYVQYDFSDAKRARQRRSNHQLTV